MLTNCCRIILCVTVFGCTLHARAETIQWIYKGSVGIVDSTPTAVDLNADGRDEIISTTISGSVFAVDSEGQLLWNAFLQIPFSISPTVVDLVEDPRPEVLAVNQMGTLFCLSSKDGSEIWRCDLPGEIEWGSTAIVVDDLNGDDAPEIVVGDKIGQVHCLSKDGELKWTYQGKHGHSYCPAITSFGDTPTKNVIVSGSQMPLTCLDATGNALWTIDTKAKGAAPIVGDINQDGKREIVTAQGTAVIAVDATGTILWRFPMNVEIDASLCMGDVDEDGFIEIYAIDLSGLLVALNGQGKELWRANVEQRARRNPAIADIDGDDQLEVIACGYSGKMHIFNGKGEPETALKMLSTANAAAIIADLNGDGTPSVIYAAGSGELVAYRWPGAKANAKVVWPEYRFNGNRTGVFAAAAQSSTVRIADNDFGDFYAGLNAYSVTIENPDAAALRIETVITRAGEAPKTITMESSETQIVCEGEYLLPLKEPCTIEVACSVYENGNRVARRVAGAYVVPFKKELADLAALLDDAKAHAVQLENPYAFLGQIAQARATLQAYTATATIVGTLPDTEVRELRDALRNEIATFATMTQTLRIANEYLAHGALNVVAANPWAPFGKFDELLEGRSGADTISIEAFSGETENAAVNVFNFSMDNLQARVELDPLTPQGIEGASAVRAYDVVQFHEVIDVPTQTLTLSADALPRMNTGRVLILPGWDARQIFMTLNTDSLLPGVWTSTLRLRTLEVESREYTLPLTITVWQPALPEEQNLSHCNWGYVRTQPRFANLEAQSLIDRAAHGNNVFVATFAPVATYNENGEIVGEIDFTAHDDFVNTYAPLGKILFFNYMHRLKGPGDHNSEAFGTAHIALLKAWVAHLKTLGVDYDQFALYPIDEPGLREGLVERYLRYAKLAREADPKILMYTDPVERIRKEELIEMLPYVDIWCPNRAGFLLDRNQDKLEIILNSGVTLWNYECADNAKSYTPLSYYRGQSWMAWHYGLTGIGFWSYCTSSADPWFKPEATRDYLMVYQGDDIVVSKRWEAVRDGIEDYDMLCELRDAVDRAKNDNRAPDAVQHAEVLLGERASAIGAFCGLEEDGMLPGQEGLSAVRRIADRRFETIQQFRRDLNTLLEALKE